MRLEGSVLDRRARRVPASPGVLVLALALCAPRGAAAEPARRPVTLGEAIAAARRAPVARAAARRTAAASADLDASGAWPATALSVATTRATARVVVGLGVPLPIFGTLSASRASARAALAIARAEERASSRETRTRAVAAWIALAAAEARASLSEAASAREQELASMVARRVEEGDAPRAQLAAANAATARARAEAATTVAAVSAASVALGGALGWEPSTTLHADGGLPPSAAPPPLSVFLARLPTHPAVGLARAQVAEARASARHAESVRWPELSLEGEASVEDPTLPGTDLRAGLALSLPLFGGGSDSLRAAEQRRAAASLELTASRRSVAAALVEAHVRCAAATESTRALNDDVLPAEREAAAFARRAYEEGEGTLVSVLEAERALAEVERALVDARAEAAVARAELEGAAGMSP